MSEMVDEMDGVAVRMEQLTDTVSRWAAEMTGLFNRVKRVEANIGELTYQVREMERSHEDGGGVITLRITAERGE